MNKKITRRKFLCNVVAVPLLGTYSYGNKILLDGKKTEICSNILSGNEATEKDEKILDDIHLLFNDTQISVVVKVINIDSFELPGCFPFQISVDCKAFDAFMAVHDTTLEFFLDKISQRDRIIRDLKANYIYFINGEPNKISDSPVTFYEPDYKRIEPKYLENRIKRMFKVFDDPASEVGLT